MSHRPRTLDGRLSHGPLDAPRIEKLTVTVPMGSKNPQRMQPDIPLLDLADNCLSPGDRDHPPSWGIGAPCPLFSRAEQRGGHPQALFVALANPSTGRR
jgi:hypothetical protein